MIKIYIEDFITGHPNESWRNVLERISDYCHGVTTDVGIYRHYAGHNISICDESLTFPNVVYIDYLGISDNDLNLGIIFPDLTKVGKFRCYYKIISFGKIKEIDEFYGYIPRKSLGNSKYRFANKETGQKWDIKINYI